MQKVNRKMTSFERSHTCVKEVRYFQKRWSNHSCLLPACTTWHQYESFCQIMKELSGQHMHH